MALVSNQSVVGEDTGRLLRGQRVVVVGGTSGIGLGTAHAAANAGAEVVVAGRRPEAQRGVGVIEQNSRIRHAVVDVTDEEAVRALFEEVGELNHLFVTATPGSGSKRFLDQDVTAAQRLMNGKFFGSWACARYAAPRMRAGDSITFLTGC